MPKLEYGQLLDNSFIIGNEVFTTLIVDPDAYDPDMLGSYKIGGGAGCPLCCLEVETCVRAYCITHDMMCSCFHCPDCEILFETVYIGELDNEKNFIAGERLK